MKIILENSSELERHAALLVDVFSQKPWCEKWEVDHAYDRLVYYVNTPHFLGLSAIEDDELIGFLFGNFEPYQASSHFIIKEMCVKTDQQRKGIGKQLLSELYPHLKKNKAASCFLLTRRDSPAETFYLDNGYTLSESMRVYFK